jgi:hypothetical protein
MPGTYTVFGGGAKNKSREFYTENHEFSWGHQNFSSVVATISKASL